MDDDLSLDTQLSDRTTPRPKSAMIKQKKAKSKGLQQSQKMNMAYASTSHYLRQAVGTEKTRPSSSDQTLGRTTSRTPMYKTQEEYYDEVLALKKQIQELTVYNTDLKRTIRRNEEIHLKKKREVEQLLDPTKNDDIRRTLAEGKPDSGIVVHGLKQRISKLEQQLRDKDAAFNKLQSDLKTTKFEEMKIQLETTFNEINRLKAEKANPQEETEIRKGRTVPSRDMTQKVKTLTATILKMSVEKAHLQAENKSLKVDLQKSLDSRDYLSKKPRNGYEDHQTKKELLATIAKLEKKQEMMNTMSGDGLSRNRSHQVEGKITLEGSVAQRLDQLDKRETELLQENAKQASVIVKLKEDRAYFKEKCDEKDQEIKSLKKELPTKEGRSVGAYSAKASPRSSSPRPTGSGHASRSSSATRAIDKDDKYKHDIDSDDAAELIRSAMHGQRIRKQKVSRMKKDLLDPMTTTDDDDDEDAADLIRSSLKGHQYRSRQLETRRRSPSPAPRSRPSSVGLSDTRGSQGQRPHSSRSPRPISGSGRNTPVGIGTRSSRPHTPALSDDDDDEDLVVPNKGKERKFF